MDEDTFRTSNGKGNSGLERGNQDLFIEIMPPIL
jgi:hypothetical protein